MPIPPTGTAQHEAEAEGKREGDHSLSAPAETAALPCTGPPAPLHGSPPGQPRSSALEVLWAFLKLGLMSFGGPVAHLGFFRTEFVERRRWLSDADYTDLVALCQFLPGPTSSQVGMALGLRRAGAWGLLAAFTGFTAPSAALLMALGYGVAQAPGLAAAGALQGLKVVAVAVVAQAVWSMARTLCPDRERAAIAFAAALLVVALPTAGAQAVAIAVGGLVGRWLLTMPVGVGVGVGAPSSPPGATPLPGRRGGSHRGAAMLLALCAALLVGLPAAAALHPEPWLQAVAVFYRAGALVFGGGHVVLPLLQTGVVSPGWVSAENFLAGYGAAQAVPGPLFTFAAYLGTVMPGPAGDAAGGWTGGLLMLGAIFLPAVLLITGALPFWETLRHRRGMQRAMAGMNAAVVGVLAAALYDPVWTGAIGSRQDVALALAAFGLLVVGRFSPLWVVVLAAGAGALRVV